VLLLKRLFQLKTRPIERLIVTTTFTILSLVSLIISSIPMKLTLIQRHKVKEEYFESKEHEITQRISKKGLCLKVSVSTLLPGLVGRAKQTN
jgi:hypothetical protein